MDLRAQPRSLTNDKIAYVLTPNEMSYRRQESMCAMYTICCCIVTTGERCSADVWDISTMVGTVPDVCNEP